jgi:outer membrane usher protein FimD/PapC
MAEDFFYRLGRAAGMAKQAVQKTKAQEIEGIETLPGHGKLSLIVNEKPDGTRIVLLKAKGSDATVYVGFDKEQLTNLQKQLDEIKL